MHKVTVHTLHYLTTVTLNTHANTVNLTVNIHGGVGSFLATELLM